MSETKENRHISDSPSIKAETWFALAIASFIVTITSGAFFALWVFSAGNDLQMVQRAQAFTPFGAAMLAVVTFFTVAWRGVLNTWQLKQATEQLAQAKRQNDAKDDENLARLLQEGAKLVSETSKQSQVLAGISTLETLIGDPKARFAVQAMDLIADYIAASYDNEELQRGMNAAVRAMAIGVRSGHQSRVGISFVCDNEQHRWRAVLGLSSCSYRGGTIEGNEYKKLKSYPTTIGFRDVVLSSCDVERGDPARHSGCNFHWCRIFAVDEYTLEKNVFTRCDFSGATIRKYSKEPIEIDARSSGNHYDIGNPPNNGEGEEVFGWLAEEEAIPF